METINYYKQNNTYLYVLLLVTSQEFDEVNYVKFFHLLLQKKMNPMVISCLLYMYTNQHLNDNWNGHMSKSFSTSNGVKQGGVFTDYIWNEYILLLLKFGVETPGCGLLGTATWC